MSNIVNSIDRIGELAHSAIERVVDSVFYAGALALVLVIGEIEEYEIRQSQKAAAEHERPKNV